MRLVLLLIGIAVTLPGCAVLSKDCCTDVDRQDFVTTGGRYCTAGSIAIPDKGLTLLDVTRQVVRTKAQYAGAVAIRSQRAVPKVLPLGEQAIEKSVSETAVSQLPSSGEFGAFKEILTDPASKFLSEAEFAILESDLRDCVAKGLEKPNLFELSEIEQRAELEKLDDADKKDKLLSLKEDVRTTVILGLVWNSETPLMVLDRTVELYETERISTRLSQRSPEVRKHQREAFRRAVVSLIEGDEFWPKESFEKSLREGSTLLKRLSLDSKGGLSGEEAAKADLSDELMLSKGLAGRQLEPNANDFVMVSVRRANGRQVSVPLFLVENYSAGDILLSPGDHVELTSFYQTSLAIPNSDASKSHVLVAGPTVEPSLQEIQVLTASTSTLEDYLKFNSNNVADVVVVRRIELSGDLHDYILPIPRPELYENAAAASELLAKTQLYPGDQLHLEVLDITPMIRESRIASQLASRIALEEAAAQEAFEKKSWIGKKLTKHHETKKAVCAKISAQTDLVTGIDPTQLTQLSQHLHQNIGNQLGMTP